MLYTLRRLYLEMPMFTQILLYPCNNSEMNEKGGRNLKESKEGFKGELGGRTVKWDMCT